MPIESFRRTKGSIIRTIRVGDIHSESLVQDLADAGTDAAAGWWQSFLRGAPVFGNSDVSEPLRIVDAFCGTGGLSLGVSLAAVACGARPTISAGIDMDPGALKVYSQNLRPAIAIPGDVDGVVDFQVLGSGASSSFPYAPEVVDARLEPLVGQTDLFLAGPPCEGHSNFNNKTRRNDPRDNLYLSAVALGAALEAKAVIIENVPEVTVSGGSVVEAAIALLSSSGYTFLTHHVLAAHELGAAQSRKRFFLVATRGEPVIGMSELGVQLRKTAYPVSWALSDLLDLSNKLAVFDESPVLSEENQRRIDWLFENDQYNLPDGERPDCHKNGHTYPSVYGRLWWDKPAQTITTGFLTPGRGRFIHPKRPRVITPHEAARLQSFPDSYSFLPRGAEAVTRKQISKLIGDAVPPVLGFTAGLLAIANL